MLSKKNSSLRLERYFLDILNRLDESDTDLIKDCNEFYNMTYCSARNNKTRKLLEELSHLLLNPFESISDNVMIFPSLANSIYELVNQEFVIADRRAFKFLEATYDISLKPKEIKYIDDFHDGQDLKKTISAYKASSFSRIVAIGGGRTMDYAKFISLETNANLLAIPSSLATHVYASPKIHALDPIKDFGFSKTIDGDPAHLTLIDVNLLEFLLKDNKRLVYSGFGDIMAFINARNDWINSANKGNERYSLFVDQSIELIIDTLRDIDINMPLKTWISEYIFIQCLLCHITDWVGSAPASGAEHLFAKSIEDHVNSNPLHGEVVALGVLIFSFIRNKDVNLTKSLIEKFGISGKLVELGLTKDNVIEALAQSLNEGLKKNRHTILQEIDTSHEYFSEVISRMISSNLISEK
tara:strand:+ start:2 stop:1237 length:1236 start_codon:yes stop_codon:yes gene_type:complete